MRTTAPACCSSCSTFAHRCSDRTGSRIAASRKATALFTAKPWQAKPMPHGALLQSVPALLHEDSCRGSSISSTLTATIVAAAAAAAAALPGSRPRSTSRSGGASCFHHVVRVPNCFSAALLPWPHKPTPPRSCSCSTFALVQRSAARHFRLTTWLCQHHGTTRLWTKARTQCARSSTISIRSGCANRSSKVVPGLQPQTNSFCKRMLHGTHAVVLGWGVCGACRILDAALFCHRFPSLVCLLQQAINAFVAGSEHKVNGERGPLGMARSHGYCDEPLLADDVQFRHQTIS